ncbi:outer membrane protein assembly factor BamE [Nitrosovibrio tenuis]|uniref:Outer membrane protein assembly factor BamE n=1 Tax=Nitrosovibrio tenuis TaxID=1233 RepID=A0A1H7G9P5_9PROT|nr:outer membrane protein assembly factor BamE [Nitrosovibrio tenuis]SEK33210.1 outer membrane protein assembly factor BamE [Nitrosovibrio tenuis]
MRARILTLVALLLLSGCSSVPSLPYKIEVQQGNIITQEMVDKLKPGMTRSQVRFALGSPMISDAFHDNRWDYVYRLEQEGRLVEQRKLTVFFENDKLVRIGGSFSPVAFNRPPTMQHIDPSRPAGAMPPEPAESASMVPLPKEGSPPPEGSPAPVAGTASAAAPSTISASSNTSGNTSGPSRPKRSSPREVPSPATDLGDEEADQPKE